MQLTTTRKRKSVSQSIGAPHPTRNNETTTKRRRQRNDDETTTIRRHRYKHKHAPKLDTRRPTAYHDLQTQDTRCQHSTARNTRRRGRRRRLAVSRCFRRFGGHGKLEKEREKGEERKGGRMRKRRTIGSSLSISSSRWPGNAALSTPAYAYQSSQHALHPSIRAQTALTVHKLSLHLHATTKSQPSCPSTSHPKTHKQQQQQQQNSPAPRPPAPS